MKIAFYISSLASGRGAERSVFNLVRELAARGHPVDLLIDRVDGWLTERLRAEVPAVRIIELAPKRHHIWLNIIFGLTAVLLEFAARPWSALTTDRGVMYALVRFVIMQHPPIAKLWLYHWRSRPDAMVSFLNDPNIALLLTTRLWITRTAVAVSLRNQISLAAANGESHRKRAMPLLMRRLLQHADLIVAVSDGVAQDVLRIARVPPDKVITLYNPVFRDDLLSDARAPIEHPWLKSSNVPTILAVGKLKPQKDFKTLLQAFAIARASRDLKLIVLGEGSQRDELIRSAEGLGVAQDVEFVGAVCNPYAYMARVSLFVLSSLWEGLPNSLIEAMACGCPVVSTNCPSGPEEILDGGLYGPLVPVGDAPALAHAMLDTINRPLPRQELIERARHFSLSAAVDRYEEVLARLTANRQH